MQTAQTDAQKTNLFDLVELSAPEISADLHRILNENQGLTSPGNEAEAKEKASFLVRRWITQLENLLTRIESEK